MVELLLWPFVAGLVLTSIHAYFGLHVLARGVVFVDLSLAQVAAPIDWAKLADSWHDGAIKLVLTNRLLRIRQQYQQLFKSGAYRPVPVNGPHADHVIAFARTHEGNAIIVAVGRRFAELTDGGRQWPHASDWKAELDLAGFDRVEMLEPTIPPTSLDPGPVSALFATIPVAILRANVRQ